MLITQGADVNARLSNDITPLFSAYKRGITDIVLRLLEHGTDVNAPDWRGNRAIHYAAWRGDVAILQTLIAKGARINEKNPLGCTVLKIVKEFNQTGAIPILKAAGAVE